MLWRVIALTQQEMVGATPIQLAGHAFQVHTTSHGSNSTAMDSKLQKHAQRKQQAKQKPVLLTSLAQKASLKPQPVAQTEQQPSVHGRSRQIPVLLIRQPVWQAQNQRQKPVQQTSAVSKLIQGQEAVPRRTAKRSGLSGRYHQTPAQRIHQHVR